MPEPDKNRIQAFATPARFRAWLRKNHATETELWVKIFKVSSGTKSVSRDDVVIEALCWGWIDGIRKSLDDEAYLQRITPRRKKSVWSQRNREHVERLIRENRMQEPGMDQVNAAKADGRWQAAYAPASEMTVPEDFLKALEKHPDAKQFFSTLNKANLFAIVYRLNTAKKPETRKKRFDAILAMLKKGERFH